MSEQEYDTMCGGVVVEDTLLSEEPQNYPDEEAEAFEVNGTDEG